MPDSDHRQTGTHHGPALTIGLCLPLPEHTALELARLADALPGDDNPARQCLRTVAACLAADPPEVLRAAAEARAGGLAAFFPTGLDECPAACVADSHLLAACVRLLAEATESGGLADGVAGLSPGAADVLTFELPEEAAGAGAAGQPATEPPPA